MTEYKSSTTRTFEIGHDFEDLLKFLSENIEQSFPDGKLRLRYRLTISEVTHISPAQYKRNHYGSRIVKNGLAKNQ